MKISMLMVFSCLLLTACTQGPIKAKNPKYQPLVDRTLRNMVFVEGGSFIMGDQKNTHIDVFGDEVYNYYFPGETDCPLTCPLKPSGNTPPAAGASWFLLLPIPASLSAE